MKTVYLRVSVTNLYAQAVWRCFSFHLRHALGMSTEKTWEDPCAFKQRGKASEASRCSLCFEQTRLYFENYALFDKVGTEEAKLPCFIIAHGV